MLLTGISSMTRVRVEGVTTQSETALLNKNVMKILKQLRGF